SQGDARQRKAREEAKGETMSTTKRPGSRSEHPPVVTARSGAPLPLMTQPIHPVDDNGQTRLDNPLARIDPALTMPAVPSRVGESAVVFGSAHVPRSNVIATAK